MENPAVVIDNGSGFTKIGYAGSAEPQHILQTAIARRHNQKSNGHPLTDLEFLCGDQDTLSGISSTHKVHFPIKHGSIEDWNAMEQFWDRCIYDKLRCNPRYHSFLLTEAPLTPPDDREQTAEIMFETFGVAGLCISVQAVLALAATWTNEDNGSSARGRDLSGLVIDSGFGSTQLVPVYDGHVMSNCIDQFDIGGRDVTSYVQQLMRERKEPVPHGFGLDVGNYVKENYSYTCPDIKKEFERYDSNPDKYIKKYEKIHSVTGKAWSCNVKYERFLAPEMMFNPELYDKKCTRKLVDIVDDVILNCPVDTRRPLTENIVLSGGNTMFKDFGRRLQRDLKRKVESRLLIEREKYGVNSSYTAQSVNVVENKSCLSSVWLGGSILASTEKFKRLCYTKAQYEEEGSRIFRTSIAFKGI